MSALSIARERKDRECVQLLLSPLQRGQKLIGKRVRVHGYWRRKPLLNGEVGDVLEFDAADYTCRVSVCVGGGVHRVHALPPMVLVETGDAPAPATEMGGGAKAAGDVRGSVPMPLSSASLHNVRRTLPMDGTECASSKPVVGGDVEADEGGGCAPLETELEDDDESDGGSDADSVEDFASSHDMEKALITTMSAANVLEASYLLAAGVDPNCCHWYEGSDASLTPLRAAVMRMANEREEEDRHVFCLLLATSGLNLKVATRNGWTLQREVRANKFFKAFWRR